MKTTTPYGFRVVGHRAERRRLVDHAAAFAAYAECDTRAELDREAYLSAFVYPDDFRRHLERDLSEAGYNGPCGASWLWWDIDRPGDLRGALRDSRRLVGVALDRYRELDEDDPLIFLSGGKGVHVGIPAVWHPEPSPGFNAVAKRFCLDLAEAAGVVVDPMIYTKTRLFRCPNSKHTSGLYKRRLSLDELTHLKPEAVVALARRPEPFDIPAGPALCLQAADDWCKARRAVESRAGRHAGPRDGPPRLSPFARRFIRDGELDDHKREVSTFRVAAELAEVYLSGGIDRLVFALLEESALDSGLAPSEVKHAIEGGLAHARRQREGGAS
jgi:hypothetical protein